MPTRKVSNNLTAELPQSLVINRPAPVDVQDDEYRGVGGSYIVDPETGKRVKVSGQPEPVPEVATPSATETLANES
jgi:hypothetical protein